MSASHEVVVTGVGALTTAGVGHEALWRHAGPDGGRAAHAAERALPAPPGQPEAAPVRLAALAPYDPAEHLATTKGTRTMSAECRAFAVAAADACLHAGLPRTRDRDPAVGIAAGTTSGGLEDYAALFATRLARGVARVNPAQGPQTGLNAPASAVSILTGAAGPNLTFSTGRAASLDALAAAARAIRTGAADVMLAGGVQLLGHAEHTARRRALAGRRAAGTGPGDPVTDAARPGAAEGPEPSVPGEAAVVLVLERAATARARGARVLARLLGGGSAFGPPETNPAARATRAAFAEASLTGGQDPTNALPGSCTDGPTNGPGGDPAYGPAGGPACRAAGGTADLAGASPQPLRGRAVRPVHDAAAVTDAFGDCAGAAGALQAALAVLALARTGPDRTATAPVCVADPDGPAAALVFGRPRDGGTPA
ncbi:beta-ketoacyl synthase N-terminal-like domain-containing protein [Streptomyces sp. NPDC048172]|uniref:beta-ketoacyl synthase N-terminal-like domain-containing protein n=1 Tax=Streptomyces sp. NPDC048172 TaxID=3365505 RepID=UPI003716A530